MSHTMYSGGGGGYCGLVIVMFLKVLVYTMNMVRVEGSL